MKEGFRNGRLVSIKKVSKEQRNPRRSAKWLCKCDCGNEKIVFETNLYGGKVGIRSCGCLDRDKIKKINIGYRCNSLTVIEKKENRKWLCKCDCGEEKIVNCSGLYMKTVFSCGCEKFTTKNSDYPEKIKKRIKEKIKTNESGCWIWKGSKHKQEYGNIAYKGKCQLAHRVSWTVFKGEIPEGIKVCHKCDVTSCVNPEHLFLGTQQDNVTDCVNKGHFQGRKQGRRRNKLTWDQVQEVKKLNECGMTRKELEIKFAVSQTCIAKILTGRSWNKNWSQEL